MRIGLMHGEAGTQTVEEVVAQIVDEERAGFDSAWFGQVFGMDAMTLLALIGQRTSRIELGTAVVPTYGRHPFAMAQQAATVSAACGGRFALGIGPSHGMVIEGMWGLSYEKPARHVREYLSVLLPLVREGRAAWSGEVYKVNAPLAVKERPGMPVLLSALAPQMLRLAGGVADGTITWMTGLKTIESHVVPSITRAAAEGGRAEPRVVVGLPVCVTDDAARARETAAKAFVIYGGLPNYRRMLDREGAAGPADVAIVGDEAAVERQVRALAAAGATDLMAAAFPDVGGASGSTRRTVELLQGLRGRV